MRKVNELFGKKVINQANGEAIAAVRDIVLSDDARRIVALVVGDGGWSKDEQVIRWSAIISVGDYVIVEGMAPFAAAGEDAEIAGLREHAHTITGKTVISSAGERVGTVGDMYFADSGEIAGYEIKQGMFGSNPILPATRVQAVGKDAIIVDSAELIDAEDFEQRRGEPRERVVGGVSGAYAPDLAAPTLGQPRDPALDEPGSLRALESDALPLPEAPFEPRLPRDAEPLDPAAGGRRDLG
jgi:uncharacterized protein YrrD